jgi:hypothetical protein
MHDNPTILNIKLPDKGDYSVDATYELGRASGAIMKITYSENSQGDEGYSRTLVTRQELEAAIRSNPDEVTKEGAVALIQHKVFGERTADVLLDMQVNTHTLMEAIDVIENQATPRNSIVDFARQATGCPVR